MSNLGLYQTMVTLAKKYGGPKILAGIVFAMGAVTGTVTTIGIGKGVKAIKSKFVNKNTCKNKGEIFEVTADGEDNKGLVFRVGDKYKVLESDGDSILIEKLGDTNNPYFVSHDFLVSISEYK